MAADIIPNIAHNGKSKTTADASVIKLKQSCGRYELWAEQYRAERNAVWVSNRVARSGVELGNGLFDELKSSNEN